MNQKRRFSLEDELEQEVLILMWKDNVSKEIAIEVAMSKLENKNLYSNEISLEDIGSSGINIKPVVQDSYFPFILGETNEYTCLSYFERYVAYLLKYNKKKEVRQILGCTSSYLSKLISRIKKKLQLSS